MIPTDNRKETIAFALWMLGLQTIDEINNNDAISKNNIGFNKPDAFSLTNVLLCINDGIRFNEKDFSNWYENYLCTKIKKYERQYEQYKIDVQL